VRTTKEVLIFVFRRSGNGEQVLLTHRCPELGGYWHTVAGGIEDMETDDEAALRELSEETGFDGTGKLDPRRHFYSYSLSEEPPARKDIYPPGSEQISVTCFRLDAPRGWEPSLNCEHDDFRWCGLEEALNLLRWPTVSEALVALSGKAHS
jgi:8-oxo-dGTP pyrophosphatase MutT (NUDIX family)